MRRCKIPLLFFAAATAFVGAFSHSSLAADRETPKAKTPIRLTDVTASTGVTFEHTDGSGGKYYIVEYVSAGLALFDYDSDGDIDIYFLNGAPMPGATKPGATEKRPTNKLYRNDGNWKFTDVTVKAGVGDTGHGLGVVVGDYDNDGDPDLYLNNFGPNVLYRNDGDGTFTDATKDAGVGNGDRVGAGTSFLDMDGDGDLDLYVANYVKFAFDKHVPRTTKGFPTYASPLDYQPDTDTLYRNNGDGTFSDVSRESGIAAKAAYGMGMVCSDIDNDGDTDVLVGNDTGANFVWRNDGKGKFEEAGLLFGFAYDGVGAKQGTMGVDCGDIDNDGLFDIHVTSYQHESATLYKNVGGFLEDVTASSGAGQETVSQVTWGNGLIDFDNDGDRDIFIACGHLHDKVDKFNDESSYLQGNMVFENRGGRFVDVSADCGDGLKVKQSSRGVAFDDLDNDGDLDVVVLNSRSKPTLLRNDSVTRNHWLDIQLQGPDRNRSGVGARVEVTVGDVKLVDEVRCGRSYQSHYGTRIHFGLGAADRSAKGLVDEVRVQWPPTGKRPARVEVLKGIDADRLLKIR